MIPFQGVSQRFFVSIFNEETEKEDIECFDETWLDSELKDFQQYSD